MEKDFFDVFPHLKVKKELEELLDMVFVTKVSMNPGRTHLRVYIESSRWIHKKNIFALEDEIERQCFPGIPMTVTVVEKFHLSEQYTPENFLESYRSSMEVELRNYNMLEFNLFRRAKITFTGKDTMHMELPDTVISRQKSEILVEYFHKVFCERCGMDLKVELDFIEAKESKYRKNENSLFISDLTFLHIHNLTADDHLTHLTGNTLQRDRFSVEISAVNNIRITVSPESETAAEVALLAFLLLLVKRFLLI